MRGMLGRRLAALTLALTVCSITAAQAATAPPMSESSSARALALARKAAPRAADFPFGWVAAAGEQGPGAGCLTTPLKAARSQAYQLAPKLSAAAAKAQATGVAAVYSSGSTAASALRTVVAARAVRCFRELLVETLAPSKITVKPFVSGTLPLQRIGDSQSATRYRVPLVQGKVTSSMYVDIAFVQRGSVVVGLAVLAFAGAPAVSDEHALLARAIARAAS
jgi:hypothetical protein